MPPEVNATPDASQPTPESPSPAVESPAPATEPTTPTQEASPATTAPESPSAPAEAVPAPETAQSPTPTAQMGRNEPLAPTLEPLPEPTPEPQPGAPAAVIAPGLHLARDVVAKARAVIQSRKRAKLDKIMATIAAKDSLTNDQVEKLLHVSDATATRYLSALEKEGKIKQVGKTGTGVVYQKS